MTVCQLVQKDPFSEKAQRDSDQKGADYGEDKGNPHLIEGEGHIGPDEGQSPHGQIEHPRAFVDQDPPEGDQSVYASDHDSRDKGHQKEFH